MSRDERFDPAECASVVRSAADVKKLRKAFWKRLDAPTMGWDRITKEFVVGISGKQLGRVLNPVVKEYEAWLQGKVVASKARAVVQLSPKEHSKVHKMAMKEASAELAERWAAHEAAVDQKTPVKKTSGSGSGGGTRTREKKTPPPAATAAVAATPKKGGGSTTRAGGTRLPNKQGAGSIIAKYKKKYAGWKGCVPKTLIHKAQTTPGESPARKRAMTKRSLTDEEEAAFCDLCGVADDNAAQLSLARLKHTVQTAVMGTAAEEKFKGGVVSKGFITGMMSRAEKRGDLDMAAPVDDSGARMDWCTYDNFENYYDDVHDIMVLLGLGYVNEAYDKNVRSLKL